MRYKAGRVSTDGGALEDWDGDAEAWDADSTSWAGQTLVATQDSVVIADQAGTKLHLLDDGFTAGGIEYPSGIGVYGLDLGDPGAFKAVRRLWPRIDAPQGTVFDIATYRQDSPANPLQSAERRQYVVGGGVGVALNTNARYIGIDLFTDEQVEWTCSGFDVEYEPRGRF